MKKVLVLILTVAVVALGFAYKDNGVVEAKSIGTKYSGEELFKGLFFAQGEVAKKLSPKIFPHDLYKAASSPEAKKTADKIIEKVKLKDASYLDYLKQSVESRNPLIIQKVLNRGGEILKSIADEMNMEMKDVNSVQPGSAAGQCLAVVWAVGIVVIYYGAVVAQLVAGVLYVGGGAVYLYSAAVQYSTMAVSSNNAVHGLSNEIFIKNIINIL